MDRRGLWAFAGIAVSFKNILIVGPSWVGDVVMATGPLAAVRRAFPGARITILLKPGRDRILEGSGDLDEVLIDRSGHSPIGLWRLSRELGARRFDLALLLPNSFRVAALAFLARVPRRVGYRRSGRGALLTDVVEYEREGGKRKPVPMPLFYRALCAAVGVDVEDTRPRLSVSAACEERAREYRARLGIREGEALIGLNPGASFGASKLWPPEHFARAADALHERYGLRSIIFLGPGEEGIGHAIEKRMRTPVINTASHILPLDVLKPLVRDLKLMVSTDTGPRQYAVAFGVPVVVVMGPTDPRYSGIHLERTEVIRHDVPCGPCHLKVCPIDHRCMVGITPEEVLAGVEALDRRLGIF